MFKSVAVMFKDRSAINTELTGLLLVPILTVVGLLEGIIFPSLSTSHLPLKSGISSSFTGIFSLSACKLPKINLIFSRIFLSKKSLIIINNGIYFSK